MTLDEIDAFEKKWVGKVQVSDSEIYFDWQPAPVVLFAQLLEACLPFVPSANQTFLDVGCGIGTKCLIAASYGLSVSGIDRVPEYINEAVRFGVVTEQMLIESFADYGDYGIVYFNHPLKSLEAEARLELDIYTRMSSGAVAMAVNYDVVPNSQWSEIARYGDWHAAWVKR